ncbi:MFS transporter [Phaeacidiphilus oryzae]|uniref:MFS transporter n=1 Tax=Phaeacidiphilus oryzae TaxID=348818 RepID=UPI00068C6F16|nr:MFS transporter [Phaeacidiphilus oryzae]
MAEQIGPGYRGVFAVGEFRAVFAAHVLSILGEVLCGIALSVLVYRSTGSPLLSALSLAVGMLPYLLGGTLLASVAERFPARRVLVVCDLCSCVCALGLLLPAAPVGALLGLRAAMAAVSPVFSGTRMGSLGEVLGSGDAFVLGRSAIRITSQAGQLAGFGAGGLLLAVLPPRAVLATTAAGFLGSALVLRFGTPARPARAAGDTGAEATAPGAAKGTAIRPGLIGQSLGGVRELAASPRVRALLLLAWVPPAFVCVPESLLTAYAARLGIGTGGLGVLMCGMPIGAVLGETLVGSRLGPAWRARLTLPVAVGAMLPALGYALRPGLGAALACQLLTGCGIAYTLGLDQRFVAAVPERLRGASMTLLTAGLMTGQGLAMAVAGTVAEWVPVPAAMAGGGVLGLLCTGTVAWRVRSAERGTRPWGGGRTTRRPRRRPGPRPRAV